MDVTYKKKGDLNSYHILKEYFEEHNMELLYKEIDRYYFRCQNGHKAYINIPFNEFELIIPDCIYCLRDSFK